MPVASWPCVITPEKTGWLPPSFVAGAYTGRVHSCSYCERGLSFWPRGGCYENETCLHARRSTSARGAPRTGAPFVCRGIRRETAGHAARHAHQDGMVQPARLDLYRREG